MLHFIYSFHLDSAPFYRYKLFDTGQNVLI